MLGNRCSVNAHWTFMEYLTWTTTNEFIWEARSSGYLDTDIEYHERKEVSFGISGCTEFNLKIEMFPNLHSGSILWNVTAIQLSMNGWRSIIWPKYWSTFRNDLSSFLCRTEILPTEYLLLLPFHRSVLNLFLVNKNAYSIWMLNAHLRFVIEYILRWRCTLLFSILLFTIGPKSTKNLQKWKRENEKKKFRNNVRRILTKQTVIFL